MLARFGSFASVLSTPPPDLRRIERLGEAGLAALKTVQAAALLLLRAKVIGHSVVDDHGALITYLYAAMARDPVEQFRVLFVDHLNRVITDEVLWRGTINNTPAYPRDVVKRALEWGAVAVIIVHNHPSGDPAPSEEDVRMTNLIEVAANSLGVRLLDHIIIGWEDWGSLRRDGFLRRGGRLRRDSVSSPIRP